MALSQNLKQVALLKNACCLLGLPLMNAGWSLARSSAMHQPHGFVGTIHCYDKMNQQVFEHSIYRAHLDIFPHGFSDKTWLTSSCPDTMPDTMLAIPMERAPKNNSKYPLRIKVGERGGNGVHSVPAPATPPASQVRHPSQFLPEQKHIHLAGGEFFEETRPKNKLEASKQHRNLCCHHSRASA
eukprot:1157443-Pelagomonas_calceolata.AAC.1